MMKQCKLRRGSSDLFNYLGGEVAAKQLDLDEVMTNPSIVVVDDPRTELARQGLPNPGPQNRLSNLFCRKMLAYQLLVG